MKKTIFAICAMLLAGMLAVSLSSCSNTSLEEEDGPQTISKLVFSGKFSYGSGIGTKAVKTGWSSGDKVYAFFDVDGSGALDAMKYVTLTYTGGDPAWDAASSASLTDLNDLGTAGTMYVVYFPFGSIDIASDGSDGVLFTSGGEPVFTYYMCGSDDYTVTLAGETAVLASDIDVNIPEGYVYFFVNKSGSNYSTDNTYRLSEEGLKPVACSGFNAGNFVETELPAGHPVWGYAFGDAGIAFSGKIDASWSSVMDHEFVLYSKDELLYKKVTGQTLNAVSSRPSVNLGTWTTKAFRGFDVSRGLYTGTSLVTVDDPFTESITVSGSTAEAASINGYTCPSSSNWETIIDGTPEQIRVLTASGVTHVTTKGYAYITCTGKGNGLLLIRDRAVIDDVITNFGGTDNTVTVAQLEGLLNAGCILLPVGTYITNTKNGKNYHYIEVKNGSYEDGKDKLEHKAHLIKAL